MFISYASNYEDVLLHRIFGTCRQGFYIDIGADHPIGASTTKSFYDRGWHGINVEPGPNFKLFIESRPRDINVNAAIFDRDGVVSFFVNENLTATSSVYEKMHPSIEERINLRSQLQVVSLTLATLCRSHVKTEISFLKIDAEGAEGAILHSGDWKNFRPKVILAESTLPFSNERIDQEWSKYLCEECDFIEVYFDGINTWFVRREDEDLREHFSYPVNLLDDFIDYEKMILREYQRAQRAAVGQTPPDPPSWPTRLSRKLGFRS